MRNSIIDIVPDKEPFDPYFSETKKPVEIFIGKMHDKMKKIPF